MKSVKDDFVRGAQTIVRAAARLPLGDGLVTPLIAGSGNSGNFLERLYELAKKPENRTSLLLIVWVIMVALLLIITAILVLIVFPLTSTNPKPGIFISAILWAFFFGVAMLFFLPSKLVTSVFGGLFGISICETTTASGLITSANQSITGIANAISPVLANTGAGSTIFIGHVIWSFLVVMAVLCLPAFFRKE
jgi:hypothetical protein